MLCLDVTFPLAVLPGLTPKKTETHYWQKWQPDPRGSGCRYACQPQTNGCLSRPSKSFSDRNYIKTNKTFSKGYWNRQEKPRAVKQKTHMILIARSNTAHKNGKIENWEV